MSLTANISPAGYALVGNPIKMSISSSTMVTYTIKKDGTDIFKGSGEGSFTVYLQEIMSNLVAPSQAYEENELILIPCNDNCQVSIDIANKEGETKSLSLSIYTGGVSKRALRRLNDDNTNIFTLKLLNASTNLFRTTRTSEAIISIKERELMPMHFLYPDTQMKVVAGDKEYILSGTLGASYALNLGYVRKLIYAETNKIVSVFEIYAGTQLITTIIIEKSEVSKENYVLEFVNSYGVYERLELLGEGSIKRNEESSDETYGIYDDIIDDYIEYRKRMKSRDEISVETGLIDKKKISFLLDMLSSDNVKILGLAGRNISVIPTAENLSLAAKSIEPISIKLKLRLTDTEEFHTGDLSNLDVAISESRIHTDEFNQIFN